MDFIDTPTLSEMLGIKQATLRYWRHAGTGPASFTLGSKVVYRRAEIERWLAEQEATTTRGGAPQTA